MLCDYRVVGQPDTKLYSLRADGPKPLDWDSMGGPCVELKTLELALDYTRDMTRFQLLQPKMGVVSERQERHVVLRRLLDQWANLLTACKKAQMNVEDGSAWPPKSYMPWSPDSLDNMPVVVWLRRQW